MVTTKELLDRRKVYDKKYRESEKGKLADKKGHIKYRKTDKGKATLHKYNTSNKGHASKKRYNNTDKGKLTRKRTKSKHRNLGFIKLFDNPFDDSELIEWHHINDIYVIAIPKDLHQLYKTRQHRNMCTEIVKQIYLKEGE